MPQSEHDNRTISSVKSGHLRSVICGQPTSVLTVFLGCRPLSGRPRPHSYLSPLDSCQQAPSRHVQICQPAADEQPVGILR